MGLTTDSLRFAIQRIASGVEPLGAHLNELDGQLGDGDLGVTLVNGFNNLAATAPALSEDVGKAMVECAKAMTKVSGSSFGTLMAVSLMAAAKQAKGRTDIPWSDLPDMLQASLDAMIARGGASLGDKTILDSLDAVIFEIRSLDEPEGMLAIACEAAACAMTRFLDRECKVGRARIFGEKTIGMDDPGMVAVKSMLDLLR